MPQQQPSLEQLAAYQQQQAAQGQGKEKEKNLVERVNDTVKKYIINPVANIPKYVSKGVNLAERGTSSFTRTFIPTYLTTAATLPVLIGAATINPLGALGVGLVTFVGSYLMTNTAFKLFRDIIYMPKYIGEKVGALSKQGVGPLKAMGMLTMNILKSPYTIVKNTLTYPIKSPARYGIAVDQQGNQKRVVIGGQSDFWRNAGLGTGITLGLLPTGGLSELAYSAKDSATSLYSSISPKVEPYLPNLRFKDGTPLLEGIKSTYKSNIVPLFDYSKDIAKNIPISKAA